MANADGPSAFTAGKMPWGRCTRWLTCITVDPSQFGADREAIRLALEAENIESRPVWRVLAVRPGITSATSLAYRHEEQLLAGKNWETVSSSSIFTRSYQ